MLQFCHLWVALWFYLRFQIGYWIFHELVIFFLPFCHFSAEISSVGEEVDAFHAQTWWKSWRIDHLDTCDWLEHVTMPVLNANAIFDHWKLSKAASTLDEVISILMIDDFKNWCVLLMIIHFPIKISIHNFDKQRALENVTEWLKWNMKWKIYLNVECVQTREHEQTLTKRFIIYNKRGVRIMR